MNNHAKRQTILKSPAQGFNAPSTLLNTRILNLNERKLHKKH